MAPFQIIGTNSLQEEQAMVRGKKNEQDGMQNIPNKSTADSCLAEVAPKALPLCKLRRRAWFSAIKH